MQWYARVFLQCIHRGVSVSAVFPVQHGLMAVLLRFPHPGDERRSHQGHANHLNCINHHATPLRATGTREAELLLAF